MLVLGQDPGAHEAIVRRILAGEAGQRVQGFLAKLGIESSYVMLNAFLYSVSSQQGGERHKDAPGIVEYRNRWLDALLVGTQVEAVIAFGRLADRAFRRWKATPTGQAVTVAYERLTHPTYPESVARRDPSSLAPAMKAMLVGWNCYLHRLATSVCHCEVPRALVL